MAAVAASERLADAALGCRSPASQVLGDSEMPTQSISYLRNIMFLSMVVIASALSVGTPSRLVCAADDAGTDSLSLLDRASKLGEKGKFENMALLLDKIDTSVLSDEQYNLYHGLRLWSKEETGQIDAALDLAVRELVTGRRRKARATSIVFIGQAIRKAWSNPEVATFVPVLHDLAEQSDTADHYVALKLYLLRFHVLTGETPAAEKTLADIKAVAGESPSVVKFLKNNIWDDLQRAKKVKESYKWMQYVRSVITQLQDDPAFLVNCGMTAHMAGLYEDALAELSAVVQKHPEAKHLLARAYWGMAISAEELGQYEMAKIYLEEVLKHVEYYTGSLDFTKQVKLRRQSIDSKTIEPVLGPLDMDHLVKEILDETITDIDKTETETVIEKHGKTDLAKASPPAETTDAAPNVRRALVIVASVAGLLVLTVVLGLLLVLRFRKQRGMRVK